MTVYEAITKKDFIKIAKFIASQPKDSLTYLCWKMGFKGTSIDWIMKCKEQRPNLHFFWAEDERKNIRAVIAMEAMIDESPPFWCFGYCCVDYEDWKADDETYFKEIADHIAHFGYDNYGILKGEYWAIQKIREFSERTFGTSIQAVSEEKNPVLGKVFYLKWDGKKYLGV